MEPDEAAKHLAEAHRRRQQTAGSGAWTTAITASVAVLAVGVVADLDLWWLSGLVLLGLAGLWTMRPLRPRIDWTDPIGAWLVGGGAVLVVAAYIAVQFPVRASGWPAPNTIGAIAAVIVILVLCRAGLQRMSATHPTSDETGEGR